MPSFNELGFALVNIKTKQFAVTEEAYRKNGELRLQNDTGYGVSLEKRHILVNAHFRFYKKESPFISLQVECFFEINKTGWKTFERENGDIVLPNNLVSHLTVLTIGTARGILHSKTEGTRYNKYILPTINVQDMIKNDDITFTAEELN